jgi:glycerol-3-phosphate O-acyltransferase / dihydroxyacetone phosphate acyltransferase
VETGPAAVTALFYPSQAMAPEARSYPRWVPATARLLLRIFFQRVEVVGAQRIPPGVPLLYAANHNNALVDPMLVVGYLPGRPRFLAKSTLWGNPVVRPLLALARAIPVHRREDPGFDPEGNVDAFARCEEVLAGGGAVALFPEGKSHAGPGLADLRTGAARIALGAERRFGPLQLRVVPVGLVFDERARFRSQVLVKVGEPLEVGAEEGAGPELPRAVTARLAAALRSVTLDYPSWDEARLLERAVDVYLHPEPILPVRAPLPERVAALGAFLEAYRLLRQERAERLAPLAAILERYDRLLAACRLEDVQVGAQYPRAQVASFLARSLLFLLLRLPLATAGALVNALPYRACGMLGARVARSPDQPATHMLIGGMVLFPLTWAAASALAAWWAGGAAALAVALLGPLGGYAAMRFRDRLLLLVAEARAYLLLRRGGRFKQRLEGLRQEIRRELLALVAEHGEALESGRSTLPVV